MADERLVDFSKRMVAAIDALQHEFTGLRTGRASTNLLDPIKVEVYGTMMPLNQVGSASVPEPRLLTFQVWDKSHVRDVERAIRDAGLGLNPAADGQLIRIPLPLLSEERRQELSKIAGKYAEEARIHVRNVRRDGMEMLKKMEKDGDISEDEHHRLSTEMQTLTDTNVKKIDDLLITKQKDIMQV
ncbi:MAG: ribosome recycling factor [Alphaproteobacteria bacterium]